MIVIMEIEGRGVQVMYQVCLILILHMDIIQLMDMEISAHVIEVK
jgi:hypothetical protein